MHRRRRCRPSARRLFCEPLEGRTVLSIAGLSADFHLECLDGLDAGSPIQLGSASVDARWADIHRQTGLSTGRETYGLTGAGQTVVVVDSGVAWDHPAVGGGFGPGYRVVGGWDFTEPDDRAPYDDGPLGSHGTHVAGILAGDDGPRQGVAPGVDIVALRVFDDQGAGYFSWVEEALEWVHDHRFDFNHPITTVNLSLGTAENLRQPPDWAVLEDELRVLEEDGVFVAVAAGNGFQQHRSVGLSYPAVSPHVTAVMAADTDGRLSTFSQRHPEAIAAPGRAVPSSVPDYVGNQDGRQNDYSNYSGTSMASPYLAGAGVLVRQAMEVAGWDRIEPRAIRDVLWQTGQWLHDSATGLSYKQLDVAAAIAAVLPQDDFASELSNPHRLGLLDSDKSLTGVIGTTTDVDYFQFTVERAGTAHLRLESSGELSARLSVDGNPLASAAGGEISFTLEAGSSHTLGIETLSGAGRYTIQLEFAARDPDPVELGRIDDLQLTHWDTGRMGNWLRLEPSLTGWLSFMASGAPLPDATVLTLYDRNFSTVARATGSDDLNDIGSSTLASDRLRLDTLVVAGQPLYLRIDAAPPSIDLRFVNLVASDGERVVVQGTAGDDTFRVQMGRGLELSVNGVPYRFDRPEYSKVWVDAGPGYDRIDVTGSAGPDQAQLGGGRLTVRGSGVEYHASNVERVHLFGGGGQDQVVLRDMPYDDEFVVKPDYALLSGGGNYYFAGGFARVYGVSEAGGRDRAYFYGSSGDDQFVAKLGYATLTTLGHYYHAAGFARYYATAGPGGDDRAFLFGSSADDLFVAKQEYATLTSGGHHRHVSGFDRVYGVAGEGGDDRAYLYDSPENDTFVSKERYATLSGEHHYRYAEAFDRVYSFSGRGGFDRAFLFDTPGDDTFVAKHGYATLSGTDDYRYAEGFSRVHSIASLGGNDRAYLYDSRRDEAVDLHFAGFNIQRDDPQQSLADASAGEE